MTKKIVNNIITHLSLCTPIFLHNYFSGKTYEIQQSTATKTIFNSHVTIRSHANRSYKIAIGGNRLKPVWLLPFIFSHLFFVLTAPETSTTR